MQLGFLSSTRSLKLMWINVFLLLITIIVVKLEETQINSCMLFFAKFANRPVACACLMHVNNCSPKKGAPMMLNEVKEEKVQEYKYWIIDGQHSIYAFKFLRFQEMRLESGSQNIIQVCEKRKSQIVVNPRPQVSTTISAIANMEAKALYVKQPYSDILKHLRSQ